MPFELIEVALRFRYVKNLWNSIIDYISQVKGLFGSFRAIDVLDILFVAFMLYHPSSMIITLEKFYLWYNRSEMKVRTQRLV